MLSTIAVFWPFYCNPVDLVASIRSHQSRAAGPVSYHVFQFVPGCNVPAAAAAVATVTALPIPTGAIGGNALPYFFAAVQQHIEAAGPLKIAALADTDAFMLRNHWDVALRRVMAANDAAGINPRSEDELFRGHPEWNWVAFNVATYNMTTVRADFVLRGLHDWGHWFAITGAGAPAAMHLWPHHINVGRAVVCGDGGGPWAVHKFYGSRTRNENITVADDPAAMAAVMAMAV